MSKSLKDQSRLDWESNLPSPTNDQLKIGCLQRIADATEVMAKNYNQLLRERDDYKMRFERERSQRFCLERTIVAHKANYTRLKNKPNKSPVCERCGNQMTAQKFEDKTTWWTCDPCADDADSTVNHLPTCGTSFRSCDADCPKKLSEKLSEEIS